jgi:hypothetical protein
MSIHLIATGAAICTRVALIGRRLGQAIAGFFRPVTDPYRPELHYMRGPGPKWRALHVQVRRRD